MVLATKVLGEHKKQPMFKRQRISFSKQVKLAFWVCLVLVFVEVLNALSGRFLNQFGLIPRNPDTLLGVLLAPLLHGDAMHFFSNIIPIAVFTLLMLQHGQKRFVLVTAVCLVLTGALVWLFAREAIHIGASGLIYSYFAYLLLAGILSRELKLVLISLLVGFSYGGLILGVLPSSPYISWESHLFGFISGLLCALRWGREGRF